MLLVHFECESAWRLKSWDRFLIPKPFSRVLMLGGPFFRVPADLDRHSLPRYAEALEAEMARLREQMESQRADTASRVARLTAILKAGLEQLGVTASHHEHAFDTLSLKTGERTDAIAARAVFGTRFRLTERVVTLERREPDLVVRCADGMEVTARAVVLALGVEVGGAGGQDVRTLRPSAATAASVCSDFSATAATSIRWSPTSSASSSTTSASRSSHSSPARTPS